MGWHKDFFFIFNKSHQFIDMKACHVNEMWFWHDNFEHGQDHVCANQGLLLSSYNWHYNQFYDSAHNNHS